MYDTIYNNAYGILGLFPNSTQKEISRRVREIEKLLKIGESPLYNGDFAHYSHLRTLQNIKTALQNISSPKTVLLEYFFRIYVNKENEISILKNINDNFCFESILKYYNHIERKSFNLKKNTAILLSLLLLTETLDNSEEVTDMNISLWHEIIDNPKCLKDFQKIYLLDDELGIDECLFDNIEELIKTELINIFSNIAKKQSNNNILSKFISTFNLTNKTYIIPQVENIYKKIDDSIQRLNELKISEDGIFDDYEKQTVRECLQSFQDEFNNLIELSLFNNEKTVILRDLVATTVRIQILDLFNNLQENDTAQKLMEFSIHIAGTKALRLQLKNEQNEMSLNIDCQNVINKIDEQLDKILKRNYLINEQEISDIINNIAEIQKEFLNKDNIPHSDIIAISDLIAVKLRKVAIELHNNYRKYKEAGILVRFAVTSAKTQKIINLCAKDLRVINKTVDENCGVNGFINKFFKGCLIRIIINAIYVLVIIAIYGVFSLFGD